MFNARPEAFGEGFAPMKYITQANEEENRCDGVNNIEHE